MAEIARARRGRPSKRTDVVAGALEVLAETGYFGAGMDAIAARASVSTRTLYHHFGSKEALAAAVIAESASTVAATLTGLIDRLLGGPPPRGELRRRLVELGVDWNEAMRSHSQHFMVVGMLQADPRPWPTTVVDAWHESGPAVVESHLARSLEGLARRGDLRLGDPVMATSHLLALVVTVVRGLPAGTSRHRLEATIAAGVDVFLRGYAPR